MPKTYDTAADGTMTVREEFAPKLLDGVPKEQVRQWTIPAEQIKPHIDGEAKAGGNFADIPAGERTKALDAHAAYLDKVREARKNDEPLPR